MKVWRVVLENGWEQEAERTLVRVTSPDAGRSVIDQLADSEEFAEDFADRGYSLKLRGPEQLAIYATGSEAAQEALDELCRGTLSR